MNFYEKHLNQNILEEDNFFELSTQSSRFMNSKKSVDITRVSPMLRSIVPNETTIPG